MMGVGDVIDRLRAGEWVATSRAFPARFPGTCRGCGSRILAGDDQIAVTRFSRTATLWSSGQTRRAPDLRGFRSDPGGIESGWMHEECSRSQGVTPFHGKS